MATVDTYFAKPERADGAEFYTQMKYVNEDPVMTGLLHSTEGQLALLNEERQIVALNSRFLQMIGIDDPYEALGLRFGEALQCIHADEGPHGCGTSQKCAECGTANAIVNSLATNEPVERHGILTMLEGGVQNDRAFTVRSNPVRIAGHRFLRLSLEGAALERDEAEGNRTQL